MDEITAMELDNQPAYRCEIASFQLVRVADEAATVAFMVGGTRAIRGSGYTEPLDIFRVSDAQLIALAEEIIERRQSGDLTE